MKAPAIALVASLFLLGSLCKAATLEKGPHNFTAKVSSVRLNAKLTSQGKKLEDSVTVSVPSILFQPVLEIADARKAAPQPIPEVNTVIAYTKANIEGSVDDIVSFWLASERPEKRKLVADPAMFKANREYYQKNPGLKIVGLVFQKETVSVLLQRSGQVVGATLRKSGDRFYLTDHPSDDLELAIIEASFNQK